MKIKTNSDDKLPLNETIGISSMMIVVTTVFYENNKYYHYVFQPYVCNRCHDSLMMSMNLSNIAVLKIKNFQSF